MNAHTNVQFIEQDGEPAFVVIPYTDYLTLIPQKEDEYIPNEVVGLMIKERYNIVKAWRVHLGLTQKQVACKAGFTQAALSQMEKTETGLRSATLGKLACAMGLSIEQLCD